jgi:hypothetical protein
MKTDKWIDEIFESIEGIQSASSKITYDFIQNKIAEQRQIKIFQRRWIAAAVLLLAINCLVIFSVSKKSIPQQANQANYESLAKEMYSADNYNF